MRRSSSVAGVAGDLAGRILLLRSRRVLIDADLATLYGVSTKAFNQAIKRNRRRFPDDFIFQLSREEKVEVVTICDHLRTLRFSPVLPYAFTEHGAIMAATVLNSPQAIEMSVYVVRAFLHLRAGLAKHKVLTAKLAELERRIGRHDHEIRALMRAIRELATPDVSPRRGIGFTADVGK